MTEFRNNFGRLIREARLQRGISGRAASKEIEISTVYYLALENGENRKTKKPSMPSVSIFNRVIEKLGIDPSEAMAALVLDHGFGPRENTGNVETFNLSMLPEISAKAHQMRYDNLSRSFREVTAKYINDNNADKIDHELITSRLSQAERYAKASKLIQDALDELDKKLKEITRDYPLPI